MVANRPSAGQTGALPLIKIENLSFGYSGQSLLYGLEASVQRGEMVGLLGPNGSGKTTLLKLLSGVLRPQQGRILLDGRDLVAWGRRGVARRIAVVPQELQVPFAFTVEQMVALGRTPFIGPFGTRSNKDRQIVREAMQIAEVETLAGRVFNELSGGERQRVIVAMALAQQPRLLLFQRGIVADGGPAEVLEPHLLRRVYGITVQVGVMHGAEHLSVVPPGDAAAVNEPEEQAPQVHIIAGGGSGALVMRALADARLAFSAGPLNIGDSDHTLALRLAGEVITEQPFAPVSEVTRQRLRACLQEISLLILCPMPIGPGNLALLEEALAYRLSGGPVLLLLPPVGASEPYSSEELQSHSLLRLLQAQERDYARGEGVRLLLKLSEAGAMPVGSLGEIVEYARRVVSKHETL